MTRNSTTERRSMRSQGLDVWPPEDVIEALLDGHLAAAAAARAIAGPLDKAAAAVARRLECGGRLAYAGAGTSGRLAVLDGTELVPTFGWPRERLVFLLAGGDRAMMEAVEGAEDDAEAAADCVRQTALAGDDVLVAVAASGTTPFTVAATQSARRAGALTIGICSDADSPLAASADFALVADSGAELVAGSTRLRAGTAQKAVLNTLSTAVMIRLGRVYDGYMIAVQPTNRKLQARAVDMVAGIAGCDREAAATALTMADSRVDKAVLVALGCTPNEADRRLAGSRGRLRPAVQGLRPTGKTP